MTSQYENLWNFQPLWLLIVAAVGGRTAIKFLLSMSTMPIEKNIGAFIAQHTFAPIVYADGKVNKNVIPMIQPSNVVTFHP